jgi:hypothetical protein
LGLFSRRSGAARSDAVPAWAGALGANDVRHLIDVIRREFGRDAPPADAFYLSPELADVLRLGVLAAGVSAMPRRDWQAHARDHLASNVQMRETGDRVEALASDFGAARDMLRLVPMRPESVPPGDVAIPSVVPEIVEVLALDAGSSVRYVPGRLVKRWGRPLDELVAHADENVRRLRLERADRAELGRPKVKAIFSDEPYGGVYVRYLERFAPDAVGVLGSLVGLPNPAGCLYRALDPDPDLRGDLVELALLAWDAADTPVGAVLGLPMWRRPDGSCHVVSFQFSEDQRLLSSWDPAFQGVLTVLSPLEHLAVPPWAGELTPAEYTLFAGLVSASTSVWPEEVAALASALDLVGLLDLCRAIDDERWPDTIEDKLRGRVSAEAISIGLLEHVHLAPERIETRVMARLASAEVGTADAATRATALPGLIETLALVVGDHSAQISSKAAEALGAPDAVFSAAEKRVAEGLQIVPFDPGFFSARVHAILSQAASLSLLRTREWFDQLYGRHGLMIAVGADHRAVAISVDDALAVLDLPGLIGNLLGDAALSSRPVPPILMWDGPAGRVIMQAQLDADGLCRAVVVSGPLQALVEQTALPDQAPLELEQVLGRRKWKGFLALLKDEIGQRLAVDPTQLVDLRGPNLTQFARECAELPESEWPRHLQQSFEQIAIHRARLDHLALRSTYDEARTALILRMSSGSERHLVSRTLPGRLTAWLALSHPPRYRPLSPSTIQRWGVDDDRCWEDAVSNLLALPDVVEEPMADGHPAWRALYAPGAEVEGLGLFLHRRHPGSKHGFVVSVTHGSRAHFIDLDVVGAIESVPAFAEMIAAIYSEARDHDDERSSVLLWLEPDGSLHELFDTLEPTPSLSRLPPAFAQIATRPVQR